MATEKNIYDDQDHRFVVCLSRHLGSRFHVSPNILNDSPTYPGQSQELLKRQHWQFWKPQWEVNNVLPFQHLKFQRPLEHRQLKRFNFSSLNRDIIEV